MAGTVLDLMIRKLGAHVDLPQSDVRALADLPFRTQTAEAGTYLTREGRGAGAHVVLLSGYTFRHKTTRSGGRQVVALQIPGEAISCSTLFFDPADHSTQALTRVETAAIPRPAFRELVLTRPAIGHAILLMTLIEASIGSEWLLNLGRRPAKERVAHLLCEFAARIDAADLGDGTTYDLPLTQEQLGDALGLTAVHVNRMLKELGAEGLVIRRERRMTFPDRPRLHRVAEFDGAYLRTDLPRGLVDTGQEAFAETGA